MIQSSNFVSSPKFTVALATQQTVRQQMVTLAQQLAAMPAINNPQIPELSQHTTQVQKDSNYYLTNISTQMDQMYSEILVFGNSLETITAQALATLKSSAPDAVAMAQSYLKGLLAGSQPVDASLTALSNSIGSFSNQISADTRNLLADQQKAQQLLAGDQAQLAALNQQLNALQNELQSKKRTEIIVGIFTFGIGAAIMELTGYIESTERDINNANNQTNAVACQVNQLLATSSALTAFVSGSAILSGLTVNLEHDWQTVNANLQEITDKQVPNSFMVATINSIMLDWQQVIDETQQLKNS